MVPNGNGTASDLSGTDTSTLAADSAAQTTVSAKLVDVASTNGDVVLGDAFKDVDFTPRFSYFKSANHKATSLNWNNLNLHIKSKHILKGVTGHVSGGEVCALMGPSGAGKSSLLNVLAGRVIPSASKKIDGDVLVNDEKVNPARFRRRIAYVMQEDRLYATATAMESLEFSARLRLPLDIANNEQKLKVIVDDLLESLGLTHVQNSLVGSDMLRGLSGGEKKRVAIGVELVTNPSLLFLDEPTSGLDSFSAWKVVKILESLSKATGCSVLCTIHQPSSEIFNSFQNVMMLCRGRVMYNGRVRDMPNVFVALGHPVPPLTNPADYVMLLAQTIAEDEKLPKFNVDENDRIKDGAISRDASIMMKGVPSSDKGWEEKDAFGKEEELHENDAHHRKAGVFRQTELLAIREFKNIRRDLGFLAVTMGIRTFMNLLFGCVFFRAADRDKDGYDVRSAFGAMLMVTMSALFGSAQGPMISFPLERGIMIREYQTGTYSSLPYLLAKLVVEVVLLFVGSTLAILASYFLLGLDGNFGLFVCTLWALGLAATSYALTLGSAVSDPKKAQEFAPLVLVPQMLFAGLFVPIKAIPVWLRWVQYLCVLKYAVNLMTLIEFGNCDNTRGFEPGSEEELLYKYNCTYLLDSNDIDIDYTWVYILIIIAIFLVFRTLSLTILVWRARYFAN